MLASNDLVSYREGSRGLEWQHILPIDEGIATNGNIASIIWQEWRLNKDAIAYLSNKLPQQVKTDSSNLIPRHCLDIQVIVVGRQTSGTMASLKQD
jgi:hypothetical protein